MLYYTTASKPSTEDYLAHYFGKGFKIWFENCNLDLASMQGSLVANLAQAKKYNVRLVFS